MEIINSNDNTFKNILAGSPKIVVKFYAGWCGSCRLIAPKFKQLAEREDLQDVVFVEVDAENNPQTRSLAKVNNLPFFATFKDGELVEGHPTSKIEAVESMIKSL
jgi:thioredoxin 1